MTVKRYKTFNWNDLHRFHDKQLGYFVSCFFQRWTSDLVHSSVVTGFLSANFWGNLWVCFRSLETRSKMEWKKKRLTRPAFHFSISLWTVSEVHRLDTYFVNFYIVYTILQFFLTIQTYIWFSVQTEWLYRIFVQSLITSTTAAFMEQCLKKKSHKHTHKQNISCLSPKSVEKAASMLSWPRKQV